jgi:hypothetical protein
MFIKYKMFNQIKLNLKNQILHLIIMIELAHQTSQADKTKEKLKKI